MAKITDAVRDTNWRSDFIDRIIRSAAQGFAAVWLASGADYDNLFTWTPVKGAIVAVALSILFSLGATQVGNPDQNSYTR